MCPRFAVYPPQASVVSAVFTGELLTRVSRFNRELVTRQRINRELLTCVSE
jgi:hypothetical protein